MGRKKHYFVVLDTETTNTIEQPICYDIGWTITDRNGDIFLKRSFIIGEIFLDEKSMMQSAYYAEKIPQYWEDIKAGTRKIKSIFSIKKTLKQDMKKFKTIKVGGYNTSFDKRALNNTIRWITKSKFRWFFPFKTEFFDIWNMACQTILNTPSFIKYAVKNHFISPSNNIITNAEVCYAFINNTPDFKESHTALEDCIIETAILKKCYRTHKKMDTSIKCNCWRLPQIKRKEMEKAGVI
ncbi:MAG: hypothetical protein LUD47_07435 [Clostridia bacterium]|nr:hypothetical protein [Clostridia bacterium]